MSTDEALALLRNLNDDTYRNIALIPNWSTIGQCWDVVDITDGNPYVDNQRGVIGREPTISEAVQSAKAKLIELGLYEE